MGVVASCRRACSWSNCTVVVGAVDGAKYTIGVDTTLTFSFVWYNASFPNVPCPNPQVCTLYYRQWNGSSWGSWTKIKGSVSTCTTTWPAKVRATGTTSFSMSSGTTYNRELFWCKKGIYQVLCDHACTAGGLKGTNARRKRVIVA